MGNNNTKSSSNKNESKKKESERGTKIISVNEDFAKENNIKEEKNNTIK